MSCGFTMVNRLPKLAQMAAMSVWSQASIVAAIGQRSVEECRLRQRRGAKNSAKGASTLPSQRCQRFLVLVAEIIDASDRLIGEMFLVLLVSRLFRMPDQHDDLRLGT